MIGFNLPTGEDAPHPPVSAGKTMRVRAAPVSGVPWMALLLAASLAAAGCGRSLVTLRRNIEAESKIVVVYGQGSVVTHVANAPASRRPTPEAYRVIAEIVRDVLESRLTGHKVRLGRAGPPLQKGGAGLQAVVSVHGGYSCEGDAPEYGCGLTVQSRITFRSLRTGRIVGGRGQVIGQVWYGRHPVVLEPGAESANRSSEAVAAALSDAIHREVPATFLLGPLESATEEGLAAFLDEVRASGG